MRWMMVGVVVAATLICAPASAQDCGAVAEGDPHPDNACEICRNGMFESLPERTACGAERRLQCDGTGQAFRRECMVDVSNPDGPNVCGDRYRFGECPNGLRCDAGFCLQECTSTADCRPDFECTASGLCARIPGTEDMGIEPLDMGTPPEDMTTGADMTMLAGDTGDPTGDAGEDASRSDLGGGGSKPTNDGCCAVARPTSSSWPALLAVLIIALRSRRD